MGAVFHDIINRRHAEKAAEAGGDGVIAVSAGAGAGGYAGTIRPFALVQEIRQVFDGSIILAGSISTGGQVAAARLMGQTSVEAAGVNLERAQAMAAWTWPTKPKLGKASGRRAWSGLCKGRPGGR